MRQSATAPTWDKNTELLKQKKFNQATEHFYQNFNDRNAKSTISKLLIGFVGSELLESIPKDERIRIFDFFENILAFAELVRNAKDEGKTVEILQFETILNQSFPTSKKDVNRFIKQAFTNFIDSEIANDYLIRSDVAYKIETLTKCCNKFYKIVND